jgi:hypothetical protein
MIVVRAQTSPYASDLLYTTCFLDTGRYDDYGGLDTAAYAMQAERLTGEQPRLFFRRDAWEWLLSRHPYAIPPHIERDFGTETQKDLFFALYRVSLALRMYGRSLFSALAMGTQVPQDRYTPQRELALWTLTLLDREEQRFRERYGESEDDPCLSS